jgi:hypothetical protein
MWYIVVAVGSWSVGFVAALGVGLALRRRLLKRLAGVRHLVETTLELENRRLAYDSGREHLARASAGQPARVHDGLGTKPGSLARQAGNEEGSN